MLLPAAVGATCAPGKCLLLVPVTGGCSLSRKPPLVAAGAAAAESAAGAMLSGRTEAMIMSCSSALRTLLRVRLWARRDVGAACSTTSCTECRGSLEHGPLLPVNRQRACNA